jgi:hypothetical protein
MPITLPLLAPIQRAPEIDASKIPSDEQAALKHISSLLASLAEVEERFRVAVLLFDTCAAEHRRILEIEVRKLVFNQTGEVDASKVDLNPSLQAEPTLGGWQDMAARDGAMSIYHFGSTVEAIKSSLPACPTLNSQVDHSTLRTAKKSFEGAFPRYKDIRHVVSHSADFVASLAQREAHSIKWPFKKTVGSVGVEIKGQNQVTQLTGNRANATYFVTFENEVHGYEISARTADRLTTVKNRIYSSIGKTMILKPKS